MPDLTTTYPYYTNAAAPFRYWRPFTATEVTWVEIVASVPEDWAGFYIHFQSDERAIVQVALGAAGSEQRIVIMPTFRNNSSDRRRAMFVPIPILAGERVSINLMARTSNSSYEIGITGMKSGPDLSNFPFTHLDCGPFDLSDNSSLYGYPLLIDPGAVPNTWSPWVEMRISSYPGDRNNVIDGSSLLHQYKYLGVSLGCSASAYTDGATRETEVAYGPAGGEVSVVHLKDLTNGGDDMYWGGESGIAWFPWDQPAGTRVSIRHRESTGSPSDRNVEPFLYGLR